MTLPNTQALKDRLRELGREGRSFSGPKMGVGQEFVSVVKNVTQENLAVPVTARGERGDVAARRRRRAE